MSNDPEQIRREIERTRGELSYDVNALGEKVNPGSIARRQRDRVRGAAVSVKESVMGSASDAADSGRHAGQSINDAVSDAADSGRHAGQSINDAVSDGTSTVTRKAKGSPIAAGLIAFGAGLLVSSMLPASRTEQRAAESVKDTAQPVLDELTDAAKQAADNLKEPAQHAVEEVKATATDAVDTVKGDATDAADAVKSQAVQSKDAVQQAAH